MAKPVKLSKSRIADGLVCEKKVYLSIHQPDLKTPVSAQQQARFDAGTDVGIRARATFPGGLLIDREYWDVDGGIRETSDAINNGHNTVYEAFFGNDEYHCRVDVLHRENGNSPWGVYEVKSGLDPKPEYILDLAIQCWVLNQCSVNWDKAFVVHLNRNCVYPDLSNLFVRSDVTEAVNDILADFDGSIESIRKIVESKTPPDKGIGRHCESPYECGFKAHCWKHVPEYSVFDLPNGWKLFEKGKLRLEEVSIADLTPTQKRPFEVLSKDYVHIDRVGLKLAISDWNFPMYHLDFETIGPAIPRYDGTSPYKNIPFQFSLHIHRDIEVDPEHKEYLHEDGSDPRRTIAAKLVEWIPDDDGIVVAYNARFEAGVLKELAELFPDLSDALLAIADRLVDPHPVIKKNVYDKNFRGGFGLKAVAPSLLGSTWDYSSLEVGDGKAAQIAFDEMIGGGISDEKREELKEQLLKYCAQDTLAMVELVKWIYRQAD